MDGDVVEPPAELVGSRAPPAAAAGVPGVLGRHAVWLGLPAAHEADLAWLALVARPPVIGARWLRSRVLWRLLALGRRRLRGRVVLGRRRVVSPGVRVVVVGAVRAGGGRRRGRRAGGAEAALELDLLAALLDAGEVVGQEAAAAVVRAALATPRLQPHRVALAVVARALAAPRGPRGPGRVEV